jgi:AbrB family looped-hinge helix DNA binding protein
METISVRVEKSGRVLLPAALRKKLNLVEGSELLFQVDDAGVRIETRAQALVRVQELFRKYIPEGRLLSEELIKDRRAEARREDV